MKCFKCDSTIKDDDSVFCEDCGETTADCEGCDEAYPFLECRIKGCIHHSTSKCESKEHPFEFTGEFDDEGRPVFRCDEYLKRI